MTFVTFFFIINKKEIERIAVWRKRAATALWRWREIKKPQGFYALRPEIEKSV